MNFFFGWGRRRTDKRASRYAFGKEISQGSGEGPRETRNPSEPRMF